MSPQAETHEIQDLGNGLWELRGTPREIHFIPTITVREPLRDAEDRPVTLAGYPLFVQKTVQP